jgi:nucleoid-associated protein YgaU
MNWQSFWHSSRSTIISAIIALVVIVGLFVIFNALPAGQKAKPSEVPKEEQQKEEQKTNEQKNQEQTDGAGKVTLPTKYTVVRGDSLWKISTRLYGTGYNWVLIARENKLANPDIIHAGVALSIPKAEVQARSYTVVRGDSLWSIAQAYYGTGYQWVKIRDANSGKVGVLPNGRPLITPGQVLVIP